MKKATIAATIISLLLFQSCYKDLSTEASLEIPEISIEGIDNSLTIAFGQTISFTPTVTQEGRTEDDFEYLWEMDITPQAMSGRMELSTEKDLEMRISNTPSDKPYTISFKATDKITGLSKTVGCRLYVGSSLGEGLLVAHTRDNGATSEFDLVANEFLTWGYTGKVRYTRNLWSLTNEGTFEGNVNDMIEICDTVGGVFNENKILVGPDEHIIAIDPLTFKVKYMDGANFNNTSESSFQTTLFGHVGGYSSYAVVNGKLFGIICHIDNKFSAVAFSKEKKDVFGPHNIGNAMLDQGNLMAFNEEDGLFYNLAGWQIMNGALSEITSNFGFDTNGAKSIAGGGTKGNRPALLVRSADGKYHICIASFDTVIPEVTHYQVSDGDLDNMVAAALCDNADLMYYTNGKEIYAVLMSGGKATTKKLSWKPASEDETVTDIFQYRQAWMGTHQYYLSDYEFPLATNRLQMVIVTYNEKTGEGKFYLRPYNVSTGLFTYKDNGSYGGFGKISSIAPLFK